MMRSAIPTGGRACSSGCKKTPRVARTAAVIAQSANTAPETSTVGAVACERALHIMKQSATTTAAVGDRTSSIRSCGDI